MERKQAVIVAATATVFVASVVMVALGHAAAVGALAPVLGLTVQQIVRAVRPRTAPAWGHRVASVPDKEDDAT
jgi:hypothetical protein